MITRIFDEAYKGHKIMLRMLRILRRYEKKTNYSKTFPVFLQNFTAFNAVINTLREDHRIRKSKIRICLILLK